MIGCFDISLVAIQLWSGLGYIRIRWRSGSGQIQSLWIWLRSGSGRIRQ